MCCPSAACGTPKAITNAIGYAKCQAETVKRRNMQFALAFLLEPNWLMGALLNYSLHVRRTLLN
jgi:hypothetical protein